MFDALVTRAAAEELNAILARGRVQAVLDLDPLSVGFEIYARPQRRYLLATADPTAARVHLVSEKLRSAGSTSSTFVLLLKKYTDGAFVNAVRAVPRERVLQIEFDHIDFGVSTLVAEIMGRYSNLILLDAAGTVLDAIKRVTPEMSRARAVLPRQPYRPPPPQNKGDPLALDARLLANWLADQEGAPLWQVLVARVAGTSPLLARELAFRATGRADATADPTSAARLVESLRAIWTEPATPSVAYEDDEPIDVAAFALTHLPDTRNEESISAALEKFFGAVESYEAVKAPLREQLEAARGRLERKRVSLEREIVPEEKIEESKTNGELIFANIYRIKPGDQLVRAELGDGQVREVSLNPDLTPVENAQRYFAEYKRAKEAAANVPARLAEAEAHVLFADQVLEDLDEAESRAEIDAVVSEAREAGLISAIAQGKGPRSAAASVPRSFVSPDGFTILVGRNAGQNEQVTFHRAGPDDAWLHVRGAAGAHVVVLAGGRTAPESTIAFAAELAAYYSRLRLEAWVDVMVAPRKNIHRVTGPAAHPGLVTVRGAQTLRVQPARQEE